MDDKNQTKVCVSKDGAPDANTSAHTTRTTSEPRIARGRRHAGRFASALLFQSTALAGSLAGLPMALYSRAYAQASCSPDVTKYTIDGSQDFTLSDVKGMQKTRQALVFNCTISSDSTISTPQYAYGGGYAYYQNAPSQSLYLNQGAYVLNRKGAAFGWQGLAVTVDNNADIAVSGSSSTSSIVQNNTSSDDLTFIKDTQPNALSVYSRGTMAMSPAFYNYISPVPAGAGGAVSITNSGTVSSSAGAGIYAVSTGNLQVNGGRSGKGGAITIVTSGDVTGDKGGIVAISQGGMSTIQGYLHTPGFGGGAAGGTVAVTVSGSANVTANGTGPAVFAASYGGNARYQPNPFGPYLYGGSGGKGGSASVTLGSKSAAMTGTISSAGIGANPASQQIMRKSGAAVAAISQGGIGVAAGTYFAGGGDGGAATVTGYGSSATLIKTTGDASAGVLAQSFGGVAQGEIDVGYTLKGGEGGTATVTLSGGGGINTSGARSVGIAAQSLGGSGKDNFNYSSGYGQAGAGGKVYVTSDFDITTTGAYAHGIVAQSANASFATAIYDNSTSGSIVWGDQNTVSTGSDAVSVTNTGTIVVSGTDAHGIVAQSIGGGGGLLTSSAALSTGSFGVDTSASQTIGGYAGGNGDDVTVVNKGAITTKGAQAGNSSSSSSSSSSSGGSSDDSKLGGGIAILAQSIGGGGGASAGQGATGPIGGSGSSTADTKSQGGTVLVHNYAALTTYGDEGHGIVVQSIGGGGGTGRNASGFFTAVGGSGGPGGDGGSATAYLDAGSVVTTSGDYAVGAVAQSIGGGGGQGGKASAWGLWGSKSVGGSGGNGGNGGSAEVATDASATITTSGSHAFGVYAQSIGGGGGSGGAAKSTSDGILFSFAIATGGSGGLGGDGGSAKVEHAGSIKTSGADATGILVQSIGGGGGAGGAATAKAVSEGMPIDEDGDTLSFNVSVAHGGAGANAGNAGDATGIVEEGAEVATTGDGAAGLVVHSIGGGGGTGGDSTATAVSKSLEDLFDDDDDDDSDAAGDSDDDGPQQIDINITTSVGGTGGGGGAGGTAYGHAQGTITTGGALADGVVVQSIGGGGGNAGVGKGSATSVKNAVSGVLAVSVGGSGGAGGGGGTATGGVSSTGSIKTSGVGSRGLVVQSIGGGGGSGGGANGPDNADWNVSIGVGGSGGAAGDGGSVYAWNDGPITTGSDFADAILAQSIGGGGGTAGLGTSSVILQKEKDDDDDNNDDDDAASAVAGASDDGDDDDSDYTVQVGSGEGGGGGDGGDVTVGKTNGSNAQIANGGMITVNGALGHGIHAQSIGGGGGKGAAQNSTDTSSSSNSGGSSDSDDKTSSFNLGASDGAPGSGGSVAVYANSVTTLGFASTAVVAQSIGGGGGEAVSSGFSVKSLTAKLGAALAGGGDVDGGDVTVDVSGTVKTSGGMASGVIAQSIGSGGGLGIVALGTTSEVHDQSASDVVSVVLGTAEADGDVDLGGGTVTVNHSGTINTSGGRSIGIVAQSIGGGGGFISATESNFESVTFEAAQPRASSDTVDVTLTGGGIVTSGDGAVGIIAQSIGGGGGFAVDTEQALNIYEGDGSTYTYGGGSSGSIGDVTVSLDAKSSIATTGDYAHGIIAQSLGGGGGLFQKDGKTYAGSLGRDGSDTASGKVTVDISGTVATKADNAFAIFAQNQTGALSITVEEGGSVTGSGAAADNGTYAGGAVWATSSASNADNVTLTVSGTLTGNAILPSGQKQYTAAGAAVSSAGPALTGTRILTTATGTLVTGAVASADTVLNAGAIDLGGAGNATRTRIDGDLVGVSGDPSSPYSASALGISGGVAQTTHYDGTRKTVFEGGVVTNFDVDLGGGGSDVLVIDGDLAGALGISVNALSLLPRREIELLRVAGAHTAEVSVLPGLVFSFADVTNASGRLSTTARADFVGAAEGLTQNQKAVATGLQAAWDALNGGAARLVAQTSGPSLGEVFANFHDATPQTFGAMAGELASRIALAPMTLAVGNAIAAADGALDCRGFDGAGVTLTEDGCVWASAYGAYGVYDGVAGESGFDARTYAMRVGGQAEVAEGWFIGGLVGYESSVFSGDERPETLDAQSIIAALSLTREFGALEISAVAGGGHTFGSSRRSISGFGVTARADPQSDFLFGRLQGAYQLIAGAAYLEPSLAVDVFGLHQAGYSESGAGALDLIVDGESKFLAGLTPALEIGTRVDIVPEVAMRLFAKGGLTFLSDDEFTSDARFAGLSAMETFQTTTPIAGTLANIAVGFDVTKGDAFELRLNYTGAFADDVQSHGGTLRLGYRF